MPVPVPALVLAFACALPQAAAALSLTGALPMHNSQVHIDLDVPMPGTLLAWTSSWQGGLNVDPMLSLFDAGGTLLAIDDDDTGDAVDPAQGFFDAGLALSVQPGRYRLVLTASFNAPLGPRLADGFAYDAELPIPVPLWDQPSFDLNSNNQKGTTWTVNLMGVQQAAVVPEPAQAALLLTGLLALALLRSRAGRRD